MATPNIANVKRFSKRNSPKPATRLHAPANDNSPTQRALQTTRALKHERIEKIASKAHEITNKARAVSASGWIASLVFPFYTIQFFFGLAMFVGAGAEFAGEEILWGAGAYFIPGQTVFASAWLVTTVIGLLSLAISVFLYTVQKVRWNTNTGTIVLLGSMVLSIVPFFNIFPWLALWMVVVIYTQK